MEKRKSNLRVNACIPKSNKEDRQAHKNRTKIVYAKTAE